MNKIIVFLTVAFFSAIVVKGQVTEQTLIGKWIPEKAYASKVEYLLETDTSATARELKDMVLTFQKDYKMTFGEIEKEDCLYVMNNKYGETFITLIMPNGEKLSLRTKYSKERLVVGFVTDDEDGDGDGPASLVIIYKKAN